MSSFPPGARRTLSIDVTRGIAMLLVCLSHFGLMYFGRAHAALGETVMRAITWPASPTFIVLSGVLLGYLFQERGPTFSRLGMKLIDRGLFLLIPADAVIRLAHHWVNAELGPGSLWIFITDAIGVCLVVGPLLIERVDAVRRVALGAALLAISWWVYLVWKPTSATHQLVELVLFGGYRKGAVFPILPWLGAYLIATPLGAQFSIWNRQRRLVARLLICSIACTTLGVTAHLFLRRVAHGVAPLFSAGQKYPPSPAYFLTAGGIGLGLLALSEWADQRDMVPRLLAAFALVGRSSLIVFVVQYVVYYVGFFLLNLPLSPLWPIYLVVSLAINFGAAWLWQRYLGNRYLTVGLRALTRRLMQQA